MKHSRLLLVASALVLMGSALCVAAEGAPKEPNFDVSKITLKVKDAALGEVLKSLAQQSGNRPMGLPEKWEDKPITLELGGVTYWDAVDAICARTKLTYKATRKSRALQLAPKGDSENVSVHAGPVVVTVNIDEMKKTNAATAIRGVRRRQCGFICVWEDRLPMLETELIFSKVLAPDGTELKVRALPERIRQLVQGDSVGPRALTYVHLLNPPQDMAHAREIQGIVRVSFGLGKDVITIDDALGGERSTTVGTSTLTVKVTSQRHGVLQLNLSETEKGKRVNPTTYPASSSYGVRLVDPKGGRHVGVPQWTGSMRREGQVIGPDGKPEGGILVRGVGHTTVRFFELPHIRGKWKLEHAVPERIVVREYPFTFRNVPLPRGIQRGPRRRAPVRREAKP